MNLTRFFLGTVSVFLILSHVSNAMQSEDILESYFKARQRLAEKGLNINEHENTANPDRVRKALELYRNGFGSYVNYLLELQRSTHTILPSAGSATS